MLEQRNSKVYIQHAVMEKQIMTDMRHRNIVQVFLSAVMYNLRRFEIKCS